MLTPASSETLLVHRHLFAPILALALALAAGHHVTVAASPLYVVCTLPDATDLYVVVDSFGSVGGAVHQCVHYWRGIPRGMVQ